MKRVFIHIGYPKALSTTLQRSYFERHPSIGYGGVGIGNNISYISNEVEYCFESLLKYASYSYWNRNKVETREEIKIIIENFYNDELIPVFSSEHLSMNMTFQGIPNDVKYDRLNYLFDDYTLQIILVLRHPIKVIRSLYREYVKMGYRETYKQYLKWLIVFQDRNFIPDLNYRLKTKQLENKFGCTSIYTLEFEDIVANENNIQKNVNMMLSDMLNIPNEKLSIKNENPSLNLKQVEALLKINNRGKGRGLGLAQTEPFERHRSRTVFDKSGLKFSENVVFSNVIEKRKALKKINHYDNNDELNNKELELERKILDIIFDFNK